MIAIPFMGRAGGKETKKTKARRAPPRQLQPFRYRERAVDRDVFVRDMLTDTTQLVSINPFGGRS